MYQTLSSTIEKITKNRKLNNRQIKIFIDRFSLYDAGDYIFPGSICIDIGIDIDTMYNILFDLEREKIVKRIYEITCNKCQNPEIYRYDDISEISETNFCNNCLSNYNVLENCIVIFMVV